MNYFLYICNASNYERLKNNHLLYLLILLLCLVISTNVKAESIQTIPAHGGGVVDSLVRQVMLFAPFHEKVVRNYNAELYVKAHLNIPKQNFGFRYLPRMIRKQKGIDDYLLESVSDLHYTAPDIYDQRIRANYGTTYGRSFQTSMFEYFHINIYSTTLFYDKILSPLSKNGNKYYKYLIDSTYYDINENLQYRIRFIPRTKSDQLVGGYMVVSSDVWSIREIRFAGRWELITFQNYIKMGDVGEDNEFLPVEYDLNAVFNFAGNVVDGSYYATFNYKDIDLNEYVSWIKRKKVYDLTESYTLSCDTNKYFSTRSYMDSLRPVPLRLNELKLYAEYENRVDTVAKKEPNSKAFWGELGEFLVSDININLAKVGVIKCSPLINPFLLSYSQSNGFSWRQDFKYNRLFKGDKLLRLRPRIGYNFTRKEFYWSMRTDFDYLPQRNGSINLNFGNGNRIYSSDILDELKHIPDSVFDFNRFNIEYFNDFYFKIRHSVEVANGLALQLGLTMHRRTPINRIRFEDIDNNLTLPPEISAKLNREYSSFAPGIRLEWTPGLYYYMNGKRKVNLRSYFPTFSVDYERGMKGVFKSTGKYEKIEFDLQHHIRLNFMRNIYYRFGFGLFSNQEELYFVDFTNFSRNNLPTGWNDDIGGIFQLLDGRWYNASRKYIRGHFTYEAPFLFMRHLMKYSRYVQNERLYISALYMPHLKPYIELGYGFGTHVFDFGVFTSFANWGYKEIGCKFTFELFNR